MEIDQDIKKEFAQLMQDEYRDSSRLPEFCNTRRFEPRDEQLEFAQIGRRVPVPTDVFESGILKPTTGPFTRSIISGERKFFLDDLINAANDETIRSIEMSELSVDIIEQAVGRIEEADTVFIPYTDEYTTTVNDWLRQGISRSGGRQLEVAGNTLNIRRIVPKFGITDVLVTNSQDIEVVQKQHADTELPTGMNPDESLSYLNEGENLMVYFAEATNSGQPNDEYSEYLDVLFRVVISQPVINKNSAVRLEAPSGIELSNKN